MDLDLWMELETNLFFFFSQLLPLSGASQSRGLGTTSPIPGLFLPGSHQDFKLNFFYSSLPAVLESWKKIKKKKRKIPISPS